MELDVRPQVYADSTIDMDDALRTLAHAIDEFDEHAYISTRDGSLWNAVKAAAGELWTSDAEAEVKFANAVLGRDT